VAKYTTKLERAKARGTHYTAKIAEWTVRRARLGGRKLRKAVSGPRPGYRSGLFLPRLYPSLARPPKVRDHLRF
jgi:hypothetical protein